MPSYNYRAMDQESNVREGTMSARDNGHLEHLLSAQGLMLIEAENAAVGAFEFLGDFVKPRLGDKELLDFTYLLKLVVASGIPLLQGINSLMKSNSSRSVGHASELVYLGVDSGLALSDVMQANPLLFPTYYVHMIRAGEASGTLENSLDFLVNYLQWQTDFKKSVKASLTYPITILSILCVLMVIIFTFVFPKMLKSLTSFGAELPLPTKVMIFTSGVMRNYLHYVVLGLIAGFIGYKIYRKTEQGRRNIDAILLRIPLIGMLIKKINLSRYFKIVATLHASGISAEKTFAIAADVVGNTVMAERLSSIARVIVTGETISDAMRNTGFIQPLVIDMMAIAERTGNIEDTLTRASSILDKEVPETIKRVFSYVEPLTMAILGSLVLLLLLAVFLPIYKSVGQIKIR